MTKQNINLLIFTLLIVTAAVRLIGLFFFGDTQLENEWEILVHNLSESGTLGFYVINENLFIIPKQVQGNEIVLPSVFMPPFYSYYIFLFKKIFTNGQYLTNVIIVSQIFLSIITVFMFFNILKKKENLITSIILSLVFSLIPINIYASVQISSICIQVFLIVCFLFIIQKFFQESRINFFSLSALSILSGLLILLRGEFILFYILTIIYLFLYFSKNLKFFVISIVITLITISPYLIRNFYHFETFTVTKSFGYNLLKGNNPEFKVEGNAAYIANKYDINKLNIEADKKFEIKLDNFYKDKAFEYIKNNPSLFIKNYLYKFFGFLFIDFNSSYEKYYNLLHLLPKIILSFLSFFGALLVLNKTGFLQFISIYFFSNIFLFSVFFILPRYSLILLPIQILLSLECVKYLLRKFFN